MFTLTKAERIDRAQAHLGKEILLSVVAERFNIPYGTLFSLLSHDRLTSIKQERQHGKDRIALMIDEDFLEFCRTYKPLSQESRRRMSKGMKKIHKKKNGANDAGSPLLNTVRGTVFKKPVLPTTNLTVMQKIGLVERILQEISEDVLKLQDLKEKIEAVLK